MTIPLNIKTPVPVLHATNLDNKLGTGVSDKQ